MRKLSTSWFVGLGGLAATVGGALLAAAWAVSFLFEDFTVGGAGVDRWMGLAAFLLIQLGLISVYAHQAHETDMMGLVGLLLALPAISVFIGFTIAENGPALPLYPLGPLASLGFLAGFLLLGFASWGTGRVPRYSAALWVLGALVYEAGVASGGPLALWGAVLIAAGLGPAGVQIFRANSQMPTEQAAAAA